MRILVTNIHTSTVSGCLHKLHCFKAMAELVQSSPLSSFSSSLAAAAAADADGGGEALLKRPKMDEGFGGNRKRIGTHNGTFHCDEALGCFLIRLTDKFAGAEIVRSRDSQVLKELDAVLDVGGVYDPSTDRFDHHQKGFEHSFGYGFATKLSSSGLVYKHYGQEIVAKELGLDTQHPDVERVYLAVYKGFMEAIDAIDNGVNQYDTNDPPKYVNDTHLAGRVSKFNPGWMEESTIEKENEDFHRAMELAGSEFQQALRYYIKSWLPARSIVTDSISSRNEVHPSGEIAVFKTYCPWKEHIFEIEQEMKVEPPLKYVIYQDERSKHWRVQAVAVSPGRFESRRPLPQAWRGLRDDELSKETGIDECVFMHTSGFVGGNKTFEGAVSMASEALLV